MSGGPLPVKIFYRIGEVAEIVGVEPHVLRYWETEFRSIRPTKSPKGQRVYKREHVAQLQKIKELLYDHRYTIAGAKRKLRGEGVEPMEESDPSAREIRALRESLQDVRGEIAQLILEMRDL